MRYFVLLACGLFLFASPCLATRSLSITSNTSSLGPDDVIQISASASGFTPGESIILKGALFQSGSSNYFGYTKKGDQWIKNGAKTSDQLTISIDAWDKHLQIKNDTADSGFKGSGPYLLKVGFYYTTSGGNISAVNWSNALDITLLQPSPSPSPTRMNTPTPTVTNTPTNIPTITPTSTSRPTIIYMSPSPTIDYHLEDEPAVLATSTSVVVHSLYPVATSVADEQVSRSSQPLPIKKAKPFIILLLIGSMMSAIAAFVSVIVNAWKKHRV